MSRFIAFWAFGIALLYPPLVFYIFFNDTLRIGLFAFVLLSLFVFQLSRSYKFPSITPIVYCWVVFFLFTIGSLYVNRNGVLTSSIGYSMILLFAIFIFGIIQSERSSLFFLSIVKYYKTFFYVVTVCSIVNFLLNILTPSINIFTHILGNNPDYAIYHYNVSPFGISINKPIFGINFVRSFFYFIEPVYLALFYLINIFVIAPLSSKRSTFIYLNIIGGIVTFSYLFFIGYLLLRALEMRGIYKVIIITTALLAYIVFQQTLFEGFQETSSIDNRLFRLGVDWEFIQSIGIQRILFGIGIEYEYISDFGINAGLLSTLIENGVAGLVFLSTIMLLFARKNTVIIIIILLGLLTLEPFKLPLFWLSVILAGEISLQRRTYSPADKIIMS